MTAEVTRFVLETTARMSWSLSHVHGTGNAMEADARTEDARMDANDAQIIHFIYNIKK